MPVRGGTHQTPPGSAPAVTRAVAVLDALAAAPQPLTLSELARTIGVPKSSTSSICTALENGGLISHTGNGFQLGRRLVELGGAFLSRVDRVQEFYAACAASDVLRQETVRLSALAGIDTLVLARYEGHPAVRFTSNIGDRDPASASAQGKALLASLDDEEVWRLYHGIESLPQMTVHSVRTVEELVASLPAARREGYAEDVEEAADNVVGLAVVIPTRGARSAHLAVSVTRLRATHTPDEKEIMVRALRDLARRLGNPM